MPPRLDLRSLTHAQERLGEALQALADAPANTLYRDATIQRFEFTYELAHKLLRRYLEMAAATPQSINEMPFPDLIRAGSEQDLLRSGWDRWKDHRKARGTTSHTYDADKALEVLAIVPDFLQEARHLLHELTKRTAGSTLRSPGNRPLIEASAVDDEHTFETLNRHSAR